MRRRYEEGEPVEGLLSEYQEYVTEPLRIFIMRPGRCEFGVTSEPDQYLAVRASKKGNSVYARRVTGSVSKIASLEIPTESRNEKGHMLLVTLTYKERGAPVWSHCAHDFNIWTTQIRREFEGSKILRVQEAQTDGTPHYHVALYVPEGIAKVGNRLASLSRLKHLKKQWPHGFSDFKFLNDWKHGVNYLSKYLTKSLDMTDQKGLLTLFYSSMYRTRIFAMSFRLDDTCITQTERWLLVCIGVPTMHCGYADVLTMGFRDGLYYFTMRQKPA